MVLNTDPETSNLLCVNQSIRDSTERFVFHFLGFPGLTQLPFKRPCVPVHDVDPNICDMILATVAKLETNFGAFKIKCELFLRVLARTALRNSQ